MNSQVKGASPSLIDRFMAFYDDLANINLQQIHQVYADDVIFKDPVHEIKGLDKLHGYMQDLCSSLEQGHFEYLDVLEGDGSAYIKWNMYFQHPKLGKELVCVRGATHILFNSHVYYHEDIYDVGEMLYEHLPFIGMITRWLKKRLAA